MSTKTTFKRIALVTVAALGFGVLTSVVPAQAAAATALNAVVGPNGATSLTVVSVSLTVVYEEPRDEATFAAPPESGAEVISALILSVSFSCKPEI